MREGFLRLHRARAGGERIESPRAYSLDVAEGRIRGVNAINNPDKLGHLGPLADLGALRHERR